ncbi:TonB-dependent receptor [Microbulbifer sp. ZKSA006]|uniref:TonB-dependent receptor n=1 Tax=Microbulbifer sp. ZKSA006 TaxID=3243390 RepID=UPI00403A76FB
MSELAGNVAVVENNALQLVGHVHVQEALARVPGANLARGNGQEYLPALRSPVLTGAGACGSMLSAMDGIPLRAAGFCNINELFDAHTEMAKRIEVVRGPGSALFGSNAMHGVINVITPLVDAHGGRGFSLDTGSHGYSRLKVYGSRTQDQHGFRADLSVVHDDGYRDDSGFDQQKLTLRHEYNDDALEVTTALAVTNLNQETAGYITGFESYKDSDLRDSNRNPEAYRDTQSLRISTQVNYLLRNGTRLTVTPYLRYTDMDFLQHFLPGDPLEKNGQKSIGVQSVYRVSLVDSVALAFGLDFEYTDSFLKQSQDKVKHYDYQVDALTISPYMYADWRLTDILSVTLGLRYEVMDYDYSNRMQDGHTDEDGIPCGGSTFGSCRYSRPRDSGDSFTNLSPKLGLLYTLSENQQVYLNLSQGFRTPQATELYRLQRGQLVADLDSEELLSAELGYRGHQQKLAYEIILYTMKSRMSYSVTQAFLM